VKLLLSGWVEIPFLYLGYSSGEALGLGREYQTECYRHGKHDALVGRRSMISYFAYGSLMNLEEIRKEGLTSPGRLHAVLIEETVLGQSGSVREPHRRANLSSRLMQILEMSKSIRPPVSLRLS
jgi:hypothetical protein